MTTSPLPRIFALALLGSVFLAGCGGDDGEGGGGRVEALAECIDKTEARAGTAESVAQGAIGAVDMLGPAAVIHVFEKEQDAKAYSDSESATQIGTVSVSSSNPVAVAIVRGCL